MKSGPKLLTIEQTLEKIRVGSKQQGDCLIWQGHKTGGYGIVSFHARQEYIHRFVYKYTKGEIPPDILVCHSCDNRACWNPDHLWLGTDADNQRDKTHKGRQPKGETHYAAALTENEVKGIRESPLNSGELSRIYRISRGAVLKIKNRVSWKHVKEYEA